MAAAVVDAPVPRADNVLRELGFGQHQIVYICCLAVFVFLYSLPSHGLDFTLKKIEYRCDVPECDNFDLKFEPPWLQNAVPYAHSRPSECERFGFIELAEDVLDYLNGSCPRFVFNRSEIELCRQWAYSERESIYEEFHVPCQEWKIDIVRLLSLIGECFCYCVTGTLSDKYGRKYVMITASMLRGITGFVNSFVGDIWIFAFVEFLNSVLGAGALSGVLVLCVESIVLEKRIVSSAIIFFSCVVSMSIFAAIEWSSLHWRLAYQVTFCPSAFNLIFLLLIPEDLRWAMFNKKESEVLQITDKITKMNYKINSPKRLKMLLQQVMLSSLDQAERRFAFRHLYASKSLMLRLFVCCFCWFVIGMLTRGVRHHLIKTLMYNYDVNFLITNILTLIGLIVYFLALDRLGRKPCLFVSLLLSSVVYMFLALVDEDKVNFVLISHSLAAVLISLAFYAITIFSLELFPTSIRHTYFGICLSVSSLGYITALVIQYVSKYNTSMQHVASGSLGFAAAILCCFLPETWGIPVPDTVAEAKCLIKVDRAKWLTAPPDIQASSNNDHRW